MQSDAEIGKKEHELDALLPFLDAYAVITGQRLQIVDSCENPDFICLRPDGSITGVELARITRGPIEAHWDRVLHGKGVFDPYVAQALIFNLLERKEVARSERYIERVAKCVLVLPLEEGTLSNVCHALDGLQEYFTPHGFSEVWVADYTGMDGYGSVELYGLYPARYWGFHQRPNWDTKPYG